MPHEIGERARTEAEAQSALAKLEATLHELRCEVSERRRAEEMLRRSEQMKALGQLTGGIAHDFNNLLGVIIGSAEILADVAVDKPQHAELAHEILNSALSGSLLTRRLLAVARNQPLRPERVDLVALLHSHVEMLRRTLGEAIRIEAKHETVLWLTSADPSQIGDALLNLALNARDAMPRGGNLTIEAANVHLDARGAEAYTEMTEGDYVVLSVTDTGTGMAEDVLQRAIEPFFTTKPPTAGSGLGLSMVYGFAKQSGGHLDIESVVGVGTTVKLYLPRSNETAEAATNDTAGGCSVSRRDRERSAGRRQPDTDIGGASPARVLGLQGRFCDERTRGAGNPEVRRARRSVVHRHRHAGGHERLYAGRSGVAFAARPQGAVHDRLRRRAVGA